MQVVMRRIIRESEAVKQQSKRFFKASSIIEHLFSMTKHDFLILCRQFYFVVSRYQLSMLVLRDHLQSWVTTGETLPGCHLLVPSLAWEHLVARSRHEIYTWAHERVRVSGYVYYNVISYAHLIYIYGFKHTSMKFNKSIVDTATRVQTYTWALVVWMCLLKSYTCQQRQLNST